MIFCKTVEKQKRSFFVHPQSAEAVCKISTHLSECFVNFIIFENDFQTYSRIDKSASIYTKGFLI